MDVLIFAALIAPLAGLARFSFAGALRPRSVNVPARVVSTGERVTIARVEVAP